MPLALQPKISVIIPAYNEEKYINKTLESLQKQTFSQTFSEFSEYEVVVVVNGCTDKTEEKVKKFQQAQQKNFYYLSLPKANVSVARNAGALHAQGELLVFLDADTQLAADALQKMTEHFTEDHAVATTRVVPDNISLRFRLALAFKNFYNQTKLYQGCSGVLICRKKDFQKVGGYDPELRVKEHRKLTLQLMQLGKYACLPAKAITSMRRYERWGISQVTWFWIKQWAKSKFQSLENSSYELIR